MGGDGDCGGEGGCGRGGGGVVGDVGGFGGGVDDGGAAANPSVGAGSGGADPSPRLRTSGSNRLLFPLVTSAGLVRITSMMGLSALTP